jgi:hypothetical protein
VAVDPLLCAGPTGGGEQMIAEVKGAAGI